uniref:Uncharacterized protein n=1 Tax=Romanomermis culicivorax TaxID=13658 RepID=A0A915J015_ROMCU
TSCQSKKLNNFKTADRSKLNFLHILSIKCILIKISSRIRIRSKSDHPGIRIRFDSGFAFDPVPIIDIFRDSVRFRPSECPCIRIRSGSDHWNFLGSKFDPDPVIGIYWDPDPIRLRQFEFDGIRIRSRSNHWNFLKSESDQNPIIMEFGSDLVSIIGIIRDTDSNQIRSSEFPGIRIRFGS